MLLLDILQRQLAIKSSANGELCKRLAPLQALLEAQDTLPKCHVPH